MDHVPNDFLENGKWKCIRCGACCYYIGLFHPELVADPETGRCKHLKNNECEIYADRPGVCRTENFPATDEHRARSCYTVWQLTKDRMDVPG